MKLSELVKNVKIKIPDTDLVIEMKPTLSWFEWLDYSKMKDETERGRFLLLKLIAKWNLTDDKGNVLPVTIENINQLPSEVVMPIITRLNELIRETNVKKKD